MPLLTLGSSAWETTHTTGTGHIVLNGHRSGYTNFDTVIGLGNYFGYTIRSEIANTYEVGIGILSAGNVLDRVEVLHSSDNDGLVNLTSDLHEVVSTLPADILQKLLKTHRGPSAPIWFAEGMQWMDDSAYPLITHRMYDTATNSWIAFASSDATTGSPVVVAIGQNITEQATAPSDTQLVWVDNSTGFGSMWPVSLYIDNAWRLVATYHTLSGNYYANTEPVVLPVASEIVQGISELATQTETDAGTDDERIITPLKLRQSIYASVLPGNIGSTVYDGPMITHQDNGRHFLAFWNGVQYEAADIAAHKFGTGSCGTIAPTGLPIGNRWLDTSATPFVLKEYNGSSYQPVLAVEVGDTFYCAQESNTTHKRSQVYMYGDPENSANNDWHIPNDNAISNSQYASTGYAVFADGLILQWGRVGTGTLLANTSTQLPVTFPIAFPNMCLSAQATSSVIQAYINATTNNFHPAGMNVTIRNLNPGGPTVGQKLTYWMAIGH